MTVICFWYSRSDFGFGRVKGKSLSGHRLQRKGSARSVKGASSVKLHYIREKLSALTETLMLKSDSELLNYYNWWFETSQTAGSPLWAAVELTQELLCSLNWLFVTLSAWTAPEPCLILSGVLAASEMKKNKKKRSGSLWPSRFSTHSLLHFPTLTSALCHLVTLRGHYRGIQSCEFMSCGRLLLDLCSRAGERQRDSQPHGAESRRNELKAEARSAGRLFIQCSKYVFTFMSLPDNTSLWLLCSRSHLWE